MYELLQSIDRHVTSHGDRVSQQEVEQSFWNKEDFHWTLHMNVLVFLLIVLLSSFGVGK